MKSSSSKIQLASFALVLALSAVVFGQESNPVSVSVSTHTRTVADGQRLKIEGIVIRSDANSFTLQASDGTETEIVLTQKTSIRGFAGLAWIRPLVQTTSYVV